MTKIYISVFTNSKIKEVHPDYKITTNVGGIYHDCGALWEKKDKNGNTYMSGEVETDKMGLIETAPKPLPLKTGYMPNPIEEIGKIYPADPPKNDLTDEDIPF